MERDGIWTSRRGCTVSGGWVGGGFWDAYEPGVVFGEMAALLGGLATATVRTLGPAVFYVIEQPREFLMAHPEASFYVAELLARRLDALNKYLIDVKRQYEGHDHLGMVDEVLEALMHRPRQRPRTKSG